MVTGEQVTNWVECVDIEVTNGLNTVTLRVRDRAGNAATNILNYQVDYSAETNPPTLSVTWPRPGCHLSGTNFTLRGLVDDETAQVEAEIACGAETNSLPGLVERDGSVWVEGVPLGQGTNWIALRAVDAAGNLTVTNFEVIKSSINLVIDDVPADQLNQAAVTVTGAINDAGFKVWVNGVAATNHGDGTWTAVQALVTRGGTAAFTATAVPLSDNGGNGSPPPLGGDPTTQNPTGSNAPSASLDKSKPAETLLEQGRWLESGHVWSTVDGSYFFWEAKWEFDVKTGGYAEIWSEEAAAAPSAPLPSG